MAECTGIGPYIDPPEPVRKEKEELMRILGVREIELTMTDEQGVKTKAIVLGRIAE